MAVGHSKGKSDPSLVDKTKTENEEETGDKISRYTAPKDTSNDLYPPCKPLINVSNLRPLNHELIN